MTVQKLELWKGPAPPAKHRKAATLKTKTTETFRANQHPSTCQGQALNLTWRFMGISRVISRATILITLLRGLIPPLITTHEPPSKPQLRPHLEALLT